MTMILKKPDTDLTLRQRREIIDIIGSSKEGFFPEIREYQESEMLIQLMHHTGPNHYDDEWFWQYENELEMTAIHIHAGGSEWGVRAGLSYLWEYAWDLPCVSFSGIKTAH